ncbi:zinc finger protein swm [Rhynchophorus ferrugineus]|uniref:C3H1-type domain-containing protein n=1 Tax=Rhynchophorus ferrugineus TaxID=354439 RepID=A0A834IS65_RHYFE|nr:hypothetical protein GWI33_022662 [Rhynchophorus ferrugineus]
MIVEQIDAFKSWLTAVLKPMCDADPAALAKYVLALIKKDKSEAELRKSMVGQLEVFLEGETQKFVNLVFQTLSTKEYVSTPVIPSANPPNPNIISKVKEGKEAKVIVQPSELPNLNEIVNGNVSEKKNDIRKTDIKNRRNSENGDRDDRSRRRSRHRSISRNRTKSRSRSWDRIKRSRSREKSRDRLEREQHRVDRDKRDRERMERDRTRLWRNKSPSRRYERRRSRSPRSPGSPGRLRSRSRSPRHSHRNRYRSSRSRSRSLEKRERRDSKDVKTHSRPNTPTQDSNHAEEVSNNSQTLSSVIIQPNNKRRCRDFDEKGYCMKGEMCPFDHGVDPVVLEDSTLTRVLSYNPNGDVTTLASGATLPGAPLPPGAPNPMRHPVVDNPYNPQAPQMWSGGRFRGPRPMGAVRLPGMTPFSQPPNALNLQRELIPVPVVMDNTKSASAVPPGGYAPLPNAPYGHPGGAPPQNYGPGGMPVTHTGLEGTTLHPGMYKKKHFQFDFNRLGPRKNPSNCSLELKKVPVGINTITHLNNHFAKFGKIVNIQVQFEGDPEAALITFSTHAEANSAYRSTEAVLNNRFIKLFWHDTDGNKQENMPPAPPKSIKDRLGGNVPPNSNKVLNLVQPKAGESDNETKLDEKDEKPELSKEETKAQATAAIKKNQDLLAVQAKVNKNKDEQRKEVLKIKSDLRKRKQELLDKQLSQQKILIEKMEKLPQGPQRDIVKETIKKTQESIEAIKKDLENDALVARNNASLKKTKEETQKELLDTELDLIAKQQEGADTTEIQQKLAELNARAKALSRGRGRGRGRFMPVLNRRLLSKNNLIDNKLKGNIKTANKIINNASSLSTSLPVVPLQNTNSFQKHTVDHRPTRLLISGYEIEEQDSVLNHFQQFGEIVDYTTDASLPSVTINYKVRKDAEIALGKGKHFQDRTLSITWQVGNSLRLQSQRSGGSSTRTVMLSESEEDHLIDQSILEGDEELCPETEEALLQDDEEEDEEDRSWRR